MDKSMGSNKRESQISSSSMSKSNTQNDFFKPKSSQFGGESYDDREDLSQSDMTAFKQSNISRFYEGKSSNNLTSNNQSSSNRPDLSDMESATDTNILKKKVTDMSL